MTKLLETYDRLFCALVVVAVSGCSSVFAPGELRVIVRLESSVASPAKPAAAHVTATNIGDGQVTWGPGSSTCQLHLLVRVDGTDFFAPVDRLCTADSRMYSLEPGESRTETLLWAGRVQRGNSVVFLESGTYEVRGAAGRTAASEPAVIQVQAGSK